MMGTRITLQILTALLIVGFAFTRKEKMSSICPGSPASVHAKCKMEVKFPDTPCANVVEEVKSRLKHQLDWMDPHNQGTYKLLSESGKKDGTNGQQHDVVLLKASRQTAGNIQYTDLLNIQFSQDKENCMVHGCSESQVTSVLDFSTNYCNLHNLYCGGSTCKPILHDFINFEESYNECKQRSVEKCAS
jgi:hypothetical protein